MSYQNKFSKGSDDMGTDCSVKSPPEKYDEVTFAYIYLNFKCIPVHKHNVKRIYS
jgi:hypothetical protein